MEEFKQFIPQGFCITCPGCCRFAEKESSWVPHLLEEECQRIAPVSRAIQLVDNKGQGNFSCQFLDVANNKCKTYPHRPFECKLYPFVINRLGKKVYLAIDLKCPYMKKNVILQDYKNYVEYLTAFFNNPLNLKIIKANPQIIQSYSDVLDIFEIRL